MRAERVHITILVSMVVRVENKHERAPTLPIHPYPISLTLPISHYT